MAASKECKAVQTLSHVRQLKLQRVPKKLMPLKFKLAVVQLWRNNITILTRHSMKSRTTFP